MSNPAPQKRKRAYRHRVTCSECKKDIVAEYQDAHARTKHIGKKVKFTVSRAPNQSQLGFAGGDETITNMLKCSKIDAENVGSDLQNDSSTYIVDSSDTALDTSEIEVIQVNNAARRAPATSEFMDVGVTDESEIVDKANPDKSEIMDMESIDNGADNDASAPDTTEIVDNGANCEIVHSANRDMSIPVVIDNSVPEKSLKSVIMDSGAPDKSDIVDGAHNSSSDTLNLYSGTCQKSSDIDEVPQQPILKCYDPKKFGSESFSRDFNPAW